MDKSVPLGSALITLAALLATPVLAQTVPDAGRILQEQAPTLEQPNASPNFNFSAPSSSTPPSGGPQVQLQGIQLSGNSLFSEAELLAVLGATTGQSYDLGGLRHLANQLTEHYRPAGYPFARVFIPAQNLADGVLHLQVVEGCYGQVSA